jgi:hypothetical protein
MRRLLKRWYVWLGLVLLLGLAGSAALICSGRGRITQANFDLIQEGMSYDQVCGIMSGESTSRQRYGMIVYDYWRDGPNWIWVFIAEGQVRFKECHFATPWETLTWYAKKGAAKVGVKWD